MTGRNLGDVRIEGGHHPIQGLDHRHLTAQSRVDVCEFKADVTAADDGDPAGKPFQVDGFITGEHRATVGLDARRNERIRTRGDDHVLRGKDAIHAAGLPQANPLSTLQATLAAQDRHPCPLQGLGQVGADRLHQLVGVVGDLLTLKPHRCCMDAEAGQVLVIGQFAHFAAGGEKCLRRNAPTVHAGSTHVPRFDDRRPEAMVGGMFGGIEAAVAGADDDDVEVETGVAHPDCCVVAVIVALRRSSSRGTAAAATFNDSTLGLWGRVTAWVQQA